MAREADNEFIISSTRDPCGYYVSLWGYIHRKPWFQAISDAYKASHGGSDGVGFGKLDAGSFTRWAVATMGVPECERSRSSGCVPHLAHAYTEAELEHSIETGAQHGILSIRFWQTLMGRESDTFAERYRCLGEGLFNCTSIGPAGESIAIERGLAALPFHHTENKQTNAAPRGSAGGPSADATHVQTGEVDTLSGPVDCWVYTANYEATLTACLKKYEAASGFQVNWRQLNRAFVARKKKRDEPHINSSKHPTCEDVFKEVPWLGRHLMAKDRVFAKAFGFHTCCGASDRPDANPTPDEAAIPEAWLA
jgi:hypothetical protein